MSHELAHIKDRDILIGSIAATLAGVIMMLAHMARWAAIFGGFSRDRDKEGGGIFGLLAMSILAPIAAMLIQFAISRSREYLADETGGKMSRNPRGLASALEKLTLASKKNSHGSQSGYGSSYSPYVYCQSFGWKKHDEPV